VQSCLSLRHVYKTYNTQQPVNVLSDVSFDFVQGCSYGIMGASGSGKSTLIQLVAGVEEPTLGRVFFNHEPIETWSNDQKTIFFKEKMSFVFQQSLLFGELTVLENVMLKEIIAGTVTSASYDRAQQLLADVDLTDKASCFPEVLSGGQQQRVAILRAIFNPPQFLVVDEPTGNLDDATGEHVIDLLLDYQKKYTMGLIVTTHNEQIARKMENVMKVVDKNLKRV
jgi:ABC-type lipoprotein export system ATPase subunit